MDTSGREVCVCKALVPWFDVTRSVRPLRQGYSRARKPRDSPRGSPAGVVLQCALPGANQAFENLFAVSYCILRTTHGNRRLAASTRSRTKFFIDDQSFDHALKLREV